MRVLYCVFAALCCFALLHLDKGVEATRSLQQRHQSQLEVDNFLQVDSSRVSGPRVPPGGGGRSNATRSAKSASRVKGQSKINNKLSKSTSNKSRTNNKKAPANKANAKSKKVSIAKSKKLSTPKSKKDSKSKSKKVVNPEKKLKHIETKKLKRVDRSSDIISKKQQHLIDKLRKEEHAAQAKLRNMPEGPEKDQIRRDLFRTQVSINLKVQALNGYQRQLEQSTKADLQNAATKLLHKPKSTKQFSAAECAKDPKCPLNQVKDWKGNDITKQVQDAFTGGKFEHNTYDKPTTLYRCTGGARDERKGGAGSWWTKTVPKDSVEAMKRLAISKDWGTSQLKKCYSMVVPAGTPLVEGTAAPQRDSTQRNGLVKGGGEQVFIPQVDSAALSPTEIDLTSESWSKREFVKNIGNMEVDMSQYRAPKVVAPAIKSATQTHIDTSQGSKA